MTTTTSRILAVLACLSAGALYCFGCLWSVGISARQKATSEIELAGVSLDPDDYVPPSRTNSSGISDLKRIRQILDRTEIDFRQLDAILDRPAEARTPEEAKVLANAVTVGSEALDVGVRVARHSYIATRASFEAWGRSASPLPDYISLVRVGHLLRAKAHLHATSELANSEVLDSFKQMSDLALLLEREPYAIAHLTAHALERNGYRLLKSRIAQFSSEELTRVRVLLDRFDAFPDSAARMAPEAAATATWAFTNSYFVFPGLTHHAAEAAWIDCASRVLELRKRPFDEGLAVAEKIKQAPPLSRDVLCKAFVEHQFLLLTRYETHRLVRALALRSVETQAVLRQSTRTDAEGQLRSESEGGSAFFPRSLVLSTPTDKCWSVTLTLPSRVLGNIFSEEERRRQFSELLLWELCPPVSGLDSTRPDFGSHTPHRDSAI